MDYFSSPSLQIGKSAVCNQISISRSNLYYKLKLPAKDLLLKQRIENVLAEHKAYGARRIALALNVGKKRVKRVMKPFKKGVQCLLPHLR